MPDYDEEQGWEELEHAYLVRWGILGHINRSIATFGLQFIIEADGEGSRIVMVASKPFRPIAVDDTETPQDRLMGMRFLQWASERISPLVEHLKAVEAEHGSHEAEEEEEEEEERKPWLN